MKKPIKSCKALDIGFGTGDNSVWLTMKHFQVTGTDISEIAKVALFQCTLRCFEACSCKPTPRDQHTLKQFSNITPPVVPVAHNSC
jgi:hypothetical protein